VGELHNTDIVIQMARCSFDAHVSDILGSLTVGATLVMLHPKGNLDFDYVARTLNDKQISLMDAVPTLLSSLYQFWEFGTHLPRNLTLKTICIGGMFPGKCNSII
jgi:non-ribosomal peptide synthetase component F